MSSSPTKITIAFDLYGTILSTSSISTTLSTLLDIPAEKANEAAELWRRYQLEYTWRANSMKRYQTFSTLTLSSLHHALSQLSISVPTSPSTSSNTTDPTTPSFKTTILSSYNNLSPFPDALAALTLLASLKLKDQNVEPYIFSNGTSSMITTSVSASLSNSASAASIFPPNRIISIDEMTPQPMYKPAPEAYHHLAQAVGVDVKNDNVDENENVKDMSTIWLVSSNPFDVVGAKNVGMRALEGF